MRKHIAVFGSPSSGKTLFSFVLADALTKDQKRVLIISPDEIIPILPMLEDGKMGLGRLFSEEINQLHFTRAVKVLRENPLVGVLGYGLQEEGIRDEAQMEIFCSIAESLSDSIIWDLTSDMSNPFCRFAKKKAELSVCILTPDKRGLLYEQENERNLPQNSIYLAGKVKPYSPYEEVSEKIGGFDGMLPFGKELEIAYLEGRMIKGGSLCHRKYWDAVQMICDRMEET